MPQPSKPLQSKPLQQPARRHSTWHRQHSTRAPASPARVRRAAASTLSAALLAVAIMAQMTAPTGAAADDRNFMGQDTLIAPIRNKLLQLETTGAKTEGDLRDAITANTLAGNIDAAMGAMRLLLVRFPQSVRGDDLYKAALLAKSMGEEEEATALLMEYLHSVGWTSVSSLSFLGTLLFEQVCCTL